METLFTFTYRLIYYLDYHTSLDRVKVSDLKFEVTMDTNYASTLLRDFF